MLKIFEENPKEEPVVYVRLVQTGNSIILKVVTEEGIATNNLLQFCDSPDGIYVMTCPHVASHLGIDNSGPYETIKIQEV